MKLINSFFFSLLCLAALSACNGGGAPPAAADSTQATSANSGSVDGFTLGVQMWTFRMFSFTDAINKVDSAGIKSIEAFVGQPLGDDMKGNFGPDMDAATRNKLKALLQSKA